MGLSVREIMILLPIMIINIVLLIIALVDIIRREKESVKGGNKLPWVLIILFIQFFGPIIYLIFGRKQ